MKQFIKWSLFSSLFFSASSFALNPVQGFYAGILGNVNHSFTSKEYFVPASYISPYTTDYYIRESFSPVGGGAGGMLGYKLSHLRLEGEVLYNSLSAAPLTVNGCQLESPNVVTPTGVCTVPPYLTYFLNNKIGFQGKITGLYGLINGYWDFFTYDGETLIVPYVGLGVGKVQLRQEYNFIHSTLGTTSTTNAQGVNTNNFSGASVGTTFSTSRSAGQIILGVSYYVDDYAWIAMDYRYLTATGNNNTNTFTQNDNRFAVHTLNFVVNAAFDKGGIDW